MIIPNEALYKNDKDAYEIYSELDSPYSINYLTMDQQERLILWCSKLKAIKSFNVKHSSYGIKHAFEKSEHGFYVTNGQMKAALICTGFKVSDVHSLNWHFNLSDKSIKQLEREK